MVSEFKSLDTLGFPNEVARLAFEGRFWTKNYPPGVGAELPPIQEVCLDAMLRNALTLYADRTAFVFAGVAFSYAEVDGLADAFAAYLHQIGVRAGDVVAVMLPNCLQFPVCFLGALRLGCRLTLLNPMYTAREVLAQLSDSQAQTIVVLENFASTVAQVLGGTSVRHVILTQLGDLLGGMKGLVMNATVRYVKRMVSSYDLPGAVGLKKAIRLGSRGGYPKPNSQLDDVVLLQYTGGTTGVPKAAMLTNRGLMSNLSQLVLWKRAALGTAPITSLTLLPLYHIYALMVNCLLFLALGARNILIANPRDTPMVLRLIRGEKIHVLTAVNSLFNSLLNNAEFCQRDHSDLKLVLSGGMALQRAVAAHWFEVTKCAVSEGFGLTEASPVVTVPVLHAHRRPVFSGMVGVPLPDTEIRILREDGGLGGVNEVGEIFVRGPQVMLGYWRRPEETVKVLSPDGWLATGDVGVMDECGFLKLLDRKKDVIIVSGFNVYPNEVEDVIASHPKVLECAVVGVAHRIRGELVKAVVVRRDSDLNEQELLDFCRVHLIAYKVPSVLEFRDVLPKSAVGKVLRRELRSV